MLASVHGQLEHAHRDPLDLRLALTLSSSKVQFNLRLFMLSRHQLQLTVQYDCVVVGTENPEKAQVRTCVRERGSKNVHLRWLLQQQGPECSRCKQEQDAAEENVGVRLEQAQRLPDLQPRTHSTVLTGCKASL